MINVAPRTSHEKINAYTLQNSIQKLLIKRRKEGSGYLKQGFNPDRHAALIRRFGCKVCPHRGFDTCPHGIKVGRAWDIDIGAKSPKSIGGGADVPAGKRAVKTAHSNGVCSHRMDEVLDRFEDALHPDGNTEVYVARGAMHRAMFDEHVQLMERNIHLAMNAFEDDRMRQSEKGELGLTDKQWGILDKLVQYSEKASSMRLKAIEQEEGKKVQLTKNLNPQDFGAMLEEARKTALQDEKSSARIEHKKSLYPDRDTTANTTAKTTGKEDAGQ